MLLEQLFWRIKSQQAFILVAVPNYSKMPKAVPQQSHEASGGSSGSFPPQSADDRNAVDEDIFDLAGDIQMNLDRQAVDEHEDSDEFVNLNMDVEVVPNVLPSLPGQALLDDVVNLKKGKFCGLRNLGATCYLNTFIQLWYHNVTLRRKLYDWRPNNTSSSQEDPSVLNNPIMSLQSIFAMMQFSKRATVDPEPLVKCLKLDQSQEQDQHKFCNLFINLIQNQLIKEGSHQSILSTICEQYKLNIAYVIKCSHCNYVNESESECWELLLRVKGFKTVEECLSDYLKEELLEGSNQYACRRCETFQNAKSYFELRRLPQLLNLQLLRFDSEKGCSKKINSYVSFPSKLNMNAFIKNEYQDKQNSNGDNSAYHLFAVLVHEGQTANSGHYITFIKREDVWYKFNDEHVKQQKDFNLMVDSEDAEASTSDKDEVSNEMATTSKTNDGKKGKGGEKSTEKNNNGKRDVHQSKNAYCLVYRRDVPELPDVELPKDYEACNLPEYLREMIDSSNV